MNPKLAAKWGSLVYFGSTFADISVQKSGISEVTKIIVSLIFPNVAITRASRNLSLFEYNTGGDGLTRETVFENF